MENFTSPHSASPAFGCAVLVLDADGLIFGANRSAQLLWRAADDQLIGQPLVSLFAFDVVSHAADFLNAQWDVLLGSALDREIELNARPRSGEEFPVRLRLERPTGAALGAYLATIQLPAPAPVVDRDWSHAFGLLGDRGALGFFDLNLATGRVHFSPAWKRILGYSPGELPDTLETWQQLMHPDDSGAAPDRIARKAKPGPRPLNVEFRMRHQLGHWIWVQCVGLQSIGESGDLERVTGVQIDITDRKDLEDTLVANDSRLQDLSVGGPLAAFELDFTNRVFWYSPAWETLLGYTPGELAPDISSLAMALPAQDAAHGIVPWLLSRAPGESSFLEIVHLAAKDGKTVPVVLGAQRTVNRKRELLRVVGFACKLPENAADAGDLPSILTSGAFNTLAECVLITDSAGQILFANASAGRLLQGEPATLRTRRVEEVLSLVNRLSQQPGPSPLERLATATHPLPLISDDALVVHADTPPLPIVWTARAIVDTAGRPHGAAIVFRNPEEMTLSPEELVRSNRFEALGLLAGGIAHDFNNLLTTILGAVSMAKDERNYASLGDAERACDTAKGLTRQLLAFAKGGSGTQTVCDPRSIIDDSLKIATASSAAEVTITIAETVDPILVDRAQMLQVFQNLIINALQAMPPKPHRARLQIRAGNARLAEHQIPNLPAGEYVEFEVRDNASGIKPEHIEKIFDSFFTTKKHGTGLGLATVLSIVRKHNGQIALDTQVGVGTAFTVYLPRATRPVDVATRRPASLRFGTGRILFMDDDAGICALTGTMLESLGYKYDLAKHGAEAIALYQRYLNIGRPYDAVIMDITVVGGMGADDCFPELQKLDPEVRAIVASGYDNDNIERKYLEAGFLAYLKKPYRVADLGKALKSALG